MCSATCWSRNCFQVDLEQAFRVKEQINQSKDLGMTDQFCTLFQPVGDKRYKQQKSVRYPSRVSGNTLLIYYRYTYYSPCHLSHYHYESHTLLPWF